MNPGTTPRGKHAEKDLYVYHHGNQIKAAMIRESLFRTVIFTNCASQPLIRSIHDSSADRWCGLVRRRAPIGLVLSLKFETTRRRLHGKVIFSMVNFIGIRANLKINFNLKFNFIF